MPKDRRKDKRKITRIKDLLTMRNFLIIVAILAVIICISSGIMIYRNYQDKQLLAKQKEELDKQIESIFTETLNNISSTNEEVNKMDKLVRISTVGDILCGDEMLMDAKNKDNSYDFNSIFKNINPFIERSDLVIGTMETNFTNTQFSGYNKSNSPREFAMAVKKAGINVVSLAHNHALDYGINGLKDTKKYLQEMNYDVLGDRLEENNILIKDVNGVKIAFLAYTYGVNEEQSKTSKELETINIFSEEQAKKDIEYAKQKKDKHLKAYKSAIRKERQYSIKAQRHLSWAAMKLAEDFSVAAVTNKIMGVITELNKAAGKVIPSYIIDKIKDFLVNTLKKKKKSQIKGGIVSNIKKGFSAMKAGGEQHKKVNSEYGKIKRKRRTHF